MPGRGSEIRRSLPRHPQQTDGGRTGSLGFIHWCLRSQVRKPYVRSLPIGTGRFLKIFDSKKVQLCTFLASPRKVPKEGGIGEALSCLLPQAKPPPWRPPARTGLALEHLILDPVRTKSVPTFCPKYSSLQTGRAARAEPPLPARPQPDKKLCQLSSSGSQLERAGWGT